MDGGAGNDTFYYSDFFDHIDGGDGFDTISFARAGSGITLTNASWNDAELNGVRGSVTQVEAITGSKYADHIDQTGGPGPDSSTNHGGSGDDFITGDGTLYGDAGNDRLVPQGVNQYGDFWTPDVYGGAGHDTFEIDFNYNASGFTAGDEATIHDFKPGTDHLEFNGGGHSGRLDHIDGSDVWTIHDLDTTSPDVSFELAGVTTLDTSDYTFV